MRNSTRNRSDVRYWAGKRLCRLVRGKKKGMREDWLGRYDMTDRYERMERIWIRMEKRKKETTGINEVLSKYIRVKDRDGRADTYTPLPFGFQITLLSSWSSTRRLRQSTMEDVTKRRTSDQGIFHAYNTIQNTSYDFNRRKQAKCKRTKPNQVYCDSQRMPRSESAA